MVVTALDVECESDLSFFEASPFVIVDSNLGGIGLALRDRFRRGLLLDVFRLKMEKAPLLLVVVAGGGGDVALVTSIDDFCSISFVGGDVAIEESVT